FGVAWQAKRPRYDPAWLPQRARTRSAKAAPVAVSSIHSRSQKSRSSGLQRVSQRRQRIPVTRGRGVLRYTKCAGDLGKGQFVPNFHDEHLALFAGQNIDRLGESPLRVVLKFKLWLNKFISFANRSGLTSG